MELKTLIYVPKTIQKCNLYIKLAVENKVDLPLYLHVVKA